MNDLTEKRWLVLLLPLVVWITARVIFWVGYVGSDDFYYVNYAFHGDRQPVDHFECRLPTIWAMRLSYAIFGPTEFAACLPGLIGSAMIYMAVAMLTGWPNDIRWSTVGALLLISVLPLDVEMASYPVASPMAAGLILLGTVILLKGNRGWAHVGGLLLAMSAWAHAVPAYFLFILALVSLITDWRRYWPPLLTAGVVTVALYGSQAIAYGVLYGNPLLRFELMSYYTAGGVPAEVRAGGDVVAFFLMPVQMVLAGNSGGEFGWTLLILPVACAWAWPHLKREQKIVLVVTIGFFLWLGYGTTVPWKYKPFTRGRHYYLPLVLGVCALIPVALEHAFGRRRRLAAVALFLLMASLIVHLCDRALWGNWVEVSRQFLNYSQEHPDEQFVAGIRTVNEIYVLNGFEFPENVFCNHDAETEKLLLANHGASNETRWSFPRTEPSAMLVDTLRQMTGTDKAFHQYVDEHAGESLLHIPPEYRWKLVFFRPPITPATMPEKSSELRSLGGEIYRVKR